MENEFKIVCSISWYVSMFSPYPNFKTWLCPLLKNKEWIWNSLQHMLACIYVLTLSWLLNLAMSHIEKWIMNLKLFDPYPFTYICAHPILTLKPGCVPYLKIKNEFVIVCSISCHIFMCSLYPNFKTWLSPLLKNEEGIWNSFLHILAYMYVLTLS